MALRRTRRKSGFEAGSPEEPTQGADEPVVPLGKASRILVRQARDLLSLAQRALEEPDRRRVHARAAYVDVRDELVARQIEAFPLEQLKDTTEGRVRIGPIQQAGYRTLGEILAAGPAVLQRIPGVGPHTITQVFGAARQVETALEEGVRVRLDPDGRPELHTPLLIALERYRRIQELVQPIEARLRSFDARISPTLRSARAAGSRTRLLFVWGKRKRGLQESVAALHQLVSTPRSMELQEHLEDIAAALRRERLDPSEVWDRYEVQAANYNGLLIDISGIAPDEEAVHGFIPTDIAARVEKQPLKADDLKVSLRGYQAFGAKFALVQKQAILGDEMGLGKTIEALAAMCHLFSSGKTHFLVVCPASVLVNWLHETSEHSHLSSFRLHGSPWERKQQLDTWFRRGGVAVTTFGTLNSLSFPDEVSFDMLVVDEAHYVKNPNALRTQSVRRWMMCAQRVLFLTGTPMENRVDEFKNLVAYLQPEVAAGIRRSRGLAGANSFRNAVAPVYLRRNQEDVLQELPEQIRTDDWVSLRNEDMQAYRNAVASGNFMAMRRAAYEPGTRSGSAKLERLAEIVEESASNDRKMVVFSYFLDVLRSVGTVLDRELVMGPITGSVRPGERQDLVDGFTKRRGPAVLVSQIEAGGVGLNLQAASVVILAEPQWKSTTEDQAIARCHRMGQVRSVNVHRLLAEDSVDQRMLEILDTKGELFDEYVRKSAVKDASPGAVDVSDVNKTRETVSVAEAERRIIEREQRRLKIESSDVDPETGGEVAT